MDLYLAVYPAIILAKLQMNIRKKLALATALGIGGVACIVAAYKCTRLPGLAGDDFSCTNRFPWTRGHEANVLHQSTLQIL